MAIRLEATASMVGEFDLFALAIGPNLICFWVCLPKSRLQVGDETCSGDARPFSRSLCHRLHPLEEDGL